MSEVAKYLYCIIPCGEDRTFEGTPIGVQGGSMYTLCHQDIAAVVSDSPVKQYESTRQNMVAHERVLETVMKEFTLLPVRFGTVANSASPAENIRGFLERRGEEFHRLLKDMEGKTELGVKAFWRDEKAIFEEIVAENAPIRKLRDALSRRSPEATHFERIRLGRMIQEALGRKKAQEASQIMLPLSPLAEGVRENPVLTDRMVVNAAFLVNKRREPEFDQTMSQLDEQRGKRLAFKCVGPVPPYNFVNIVVNWQEPGQG